MRNSKKWMHIVARVLLPAIALLLILPGPARADWTLWDWSINVNGTIYNLGDTLPANVNASGFHFDTGLGTIKITFDTAGSNFGGVYFYNFFDYGSGVDSSDAFGKVNFAAPAGVTYEIGWPGQDPHSPSPSVWTSFASDALDNGNHADTYHPPAAFPDPGACCSVAMAMINHFTVGSGDEATLLFNVGPLAPLGFNLQETAHDTINVDGVMESIFLSETLRTGGVAPVPEPAAILLLVPVAGVALLKLRRRKA